MAHMHAHPCGHALTHKSATLNHRAKIPMPPCHNQCGEGNCQGASLQAHLVVGEALKHRAADEAGARSLGSNVQTHTRSVHMGG